MRVSELLKYAIIVLIPFAVQLVVLFLTEKRFRPLRFAVPVLAVIAGVVLFLDGILSPIARAFWWIVLPLILLGLGLVLSGYALAEFVYYLIKRKGEPAHE